MRKLVSLAVCLGVVACADPGSSLNGPLEVLDPAPFDPTQAATDPPSRTVSYQYTKLTCPTSDGHCANWHLRQLAADYAQHRNSVMRGSYIFDIPLVGLAATLAVGTGNHFATTTMGGLAVGSAGVLGARAYLSPGTKAAAYGAASGALQCGAAGAERLQAIQDGEKPEDTAADLQVSISAASQSDKSDPLLPAARTAQKSLADAQAVLDGAPARLGFIAASIVRNTTQKITTGTQDITSLLSQIGAAGPSSSAKSAAPPAGGPGPSPKGQQALNNRTQPHTPRVRPLVEVTAAAEGVAKNVNDAWSDMGNCVIVKAAS